MNKLPKISCQCITYGRTTLLNEAVQSFLIQDYPGEKELIILNDYSELKLTGNIPNVKIINLPERIATVGEKRNICVDYCTGDIIFPWDDDDISLKHRISYSLEKMTNGHYYKPDKFWFWENGVIKKEPQKNVAHAMCCFSKDIFKKVDGYPLIQSGQDMGLEDKFGKAGVRIVENIDKKNIYYIYKFGGTYSYHLSGYGFKKGYEESEKYVKNKVKIKEFEIKPQWYQEYDKMVEGIKNETI